MDTSDGEPNAYSPADLQTLMDSLGLRNADLARMVRVDRGAPGRWLSGEVAVPSWLIAHLEAVQELRSVCSAASPLLAPSLPLRLQPYRSSTLPSLEGNKTGLSIPIEGTGSIKVEAMETEQGMDSAAFTAGLAAIGWRQADFARHVGCDVKTPSRWATGKAPIPAWVGAHLSLLQQIQRLQGFLRPVRERKARGSP